MPSSSSTNQDHGIASAADLCAAAAAAVVPSRRGRPKSKRSEDFASFLRTREEIDALCEEHGVASATDLDAAATYAPSRPRTRRGRLKAKRPEEYPSFLRTQDEIDALCKENGVPKEFTARPVGDLRANATPPPGAICVYVPALEAGMRVPLDGFFCEALVHFGIAPAQLTPNGWRIMAGFLGLCRSVGVPPSLAVFRQFFLLCIVTKRYKKGWYFFQSRDSSGLRFTGMPDPNWISFKYWKHEYFFLSSPEPWSSPLEWGERSKCSFRNLVLTGEEKTWAAKLLRAHGGAAVDVRTYLRNSSNLPAGKITTSLVLAPPAPSSTCIISSPGPGGMDPSVYGMMKTLLAEKAAAQAKKVKAEPGSKAAGSLPLGEKRRLEEANDKDLPPATTLNTALSSRKPHHFPSWHDGDCTDDWVDAHAREQLEEANRKFASANREAEQEKAKADLAATRAEVAKANAGLEAAEAEVVKAKAELTAAKRAAEAGQEERPELAMEVAKAKAKLAAAKRALEEELESAKAAALRQLLCSEDHVRRRAEHALEGYKRWRTGPTPAGRVA